jgi:hypothetical protein
MLINPSLGLILVAYLILMHMVFDLNLYNAFVYKLYYINRLG